MFAYCGNNPVMYRDDTGTNRSHTMVCISDGGGAPHNNYTIVGYTSSIGRVLILCFKEGISKDEKSYYAEKYSNYIVVFDHRHCIEGCTECNPNMQIWNSHMIDESAKQREILEILVKHDQMYPSYHSWGRTVDSMLKEWDVHNDVYKTADDFNNIIDIIPDDYLYRVAHTDFDFKDENTKRWEYLIRIFRGVY